MKNSETKDIQSHSRNTVLGAVLLTNFKEMKQTLKERMENMLCRIVGRVEMLQKSIN